MTVQLLQDTIRAVEVVHRKHFKTLDGYVRNARIVLWATTSEGKRVWIRTVEGGLDSLNITVKVAMAQKFFSDLIGHEIRFRIGELEGENIFFAEELCLPAKFLVSYEEIKTELWEWVETNHAEDLERLRKEKSAKAAATRKRNADMRKHWAAQFGLPEDTPLEIIRNAEKQYWIRRQEAWRASQERKRMGELEERREKAIHLAFRKGRNPKHGNAQWEARLNGLLHILRREDNYAPSDEKIPVELDYPLVPGRIVLVRRI